MVMQFIFCRLYNWYSERFNSLTQMPIYTQLVCKNIMLEKCSRWKALGNVALCLLTWKNKHFLTIPQLFGVLQIILFGYMKDYFFCCWHPLDSLRLTVLPVEQSLGRLALRWGLEYISDAAPGLSPCPMLRVTGRLRTISDSGETEDPPMRTGVLAMEGLWENKFEKHLFAHP